MTQVTIASILSMVLDKSLMAQIHVIVLVAQFSLMHIYFKVAQCQLIYCTKVVEGKSKFLIYL